MDHDLTIEQLRALGRAAPTNPPARLPDPRPYSYERACELLASTIALVESRTREIEDARRQAEERERVEHAQRGAMGEFIALVLWTTALTVGLAAVVGLVELIRWWVS